MGKSKSSSTQTSAPLTPDQVAAYSAKLDSITGGRLFDFAKTGTPRVDYVAPDVDINYQRPNTSVSYTAPNARAGYTAPNARATYVAPRGDQFSVNAVRKLGGLGETRRLAARRARDQEFQEIGADPNLSVFQRQRSRQLVNQDANSQIDAVNKESEAAIADLVNFIAGKRADIAGRDAAARFEASKTNAANARTDARGRLDASTTNAANARTDARARTDAQTRTREFEAGAARDQLTADTDEARLLELIARQRYSAGADQAEQRRQDMATIADIFFGGTGNTNTSSSKSRGGLSDLFTISI